MCGINGFIKRSAQSEEKSYGDLKLMNNQIIHRGPDEEGSYIDTNSLYQIAMAMRRLSIIDLSTGSQPIFNDDKSLVIVFNGEIYNFPELKANLVNKGITFYTQSDTEVILRLYEIYGTKSFSMLDGAFGFSIYDKNLKKLFIARDFFGEKPIYFTQQNDTFIWASELKSIIKLLPQKPQICTSALNLYFQLTYIPSPYSIYQDIFKLQANHYIEFNCIDFTYKLNEIDRANDSVIKPENFHEAKLLTFEYVMNSVKSRSISDVPLGTFLSGGVDSSIISWCLANQSSTKIDTFSIGFEKKSFDESGKAKTVAKLINSIHHEFIISETDLSLKLNEIILNFDEPFGDSSALASYLVSHYTSKNVKVALTGDGGDEVFGGYNKYLIGKINQSYTKLIPQSLHSNFAKIISKFSNLNEDNRGLRFKLNRIVKAVNYEQDFYYNIISLGFQNNELAGILSPRFVNNQAINFYKNLVGISKNSLTQFREIDRILSLEGDMVVKVDRTSMLASIECRSPFLNKKLWNFTKQLPEDYLIKGWNKKYLLKESFKENFPKGFFNQSKKGFGVPVGDWLKKELKNELLKYIEPNLILKQGIFNLELLSEMILNHISGRVDNTFRVWTFYCFQKWYTNTYEK